TEAAAMLVTSEPNVRYLTGFTGDSTYLFLSPQSTILISDSRFATQLEEDCAGVETHIRTQKTKLVDATAKVLNQTRTTRVAVEPDHMSVSIWEQLRTAAKTTELTPVSGKVEELRAVKDAGEIAEIREAVRLAERAFRVVTAGM